MPVDKFELPQERKQGGDKAVSPALVVSIPNNSIHLSQMALLLTDVTCRREQVRVLCEWMKGAGFCWGFFIFCFCFYFFFPLCLLRRAVGCGLHVLYITDTVLLGRLSCWDFQPRSLSSSHSFRFDLTKAGGTKEGLVLFLKGQSLGGKAACREFQLLNQNSDASVFIFLPFIH